MKRTYPSRQTDMIIFAAEVIEDLFEEDIPALLLTIRDGLKNGGILVPTIPGGNCTRIEATQNTI